MAVGLIVHADQAEGILRNGEADLIALGREYLVNPHWAIDAALKLGVADPYAQVPPRVRLLPGTPQEELRAAPALHLATGNGPGTERTLARPPRFKRVVRGDRAAQVAVAAAFGL